MSRLIVKNLPNTITEDRLREIFGEKGLITDVKLKYTKDGLFRGFAFVGFKFDSEAKVAREFFNNTFVGLSKIQVETCLPLGDATKPRAWSKYSKDSSNYQKKIKKEDKETDGELRKKDIQEKNRENTLAKEKVLKKLKEDPYFAEFLDVNKQSDTKYLWANDAGNVVLENQKKSEKDDCSSHPEDEKKSSEDENEESDVKLDFAQRNKANYQQSDLEFLRSKMVKKTDLQQNKKNEKEVMLDGDVMVKEHHQKKIIDNSFTVKLRNLPYKIKKKHIKEFFSPLVTQQIRLPFKIKGIAFVKLNSEKEVNKALCKHKSFLKGHRIEVVVYNPKDIAIEKAKKEERKLKWEKNAKELEEEEPVAESGRLFVRNLSYTATEEELREYFAKYGPLAEINLPIDKLSRQSKGFAFITYVIPENAVKAFTEEDGKIFQGRTLHILPGKAAKETAKLTDTMPYKEKKDAKQKLHSSSSFNWNTLFLGTDAVAEAMAERYHVEKSKILNSESNENIAVRLALGETQLVSETRDFLIRNGIQLDSFQAAERSETVILVKNLPKKTSTPEIFKIFSVFGEIGRIVMPPHCITAVVEFLEPSEARNAFKKLAYTKFKGVPLFLEWAPVKIFANACIQKLDPSQLQDEKGKRDILEKEQIDKNEIEDAIGGSGDDDDDGDEDANEPEPDTTIFIKNLNFETTDKELYQHFAKYGTIHYAIVSRKKDLKNPGNFLSLGFGFVQFKKKVSTELCLKELQHSMLDGHCIELKLSNRTLNTPSLPKMARVNKSKASPSTNILVRNIPFQAKQSEIQELFRPFGEIKSVRLPLKMMGKNSHRGFGFVDYFTKHDAKRAFKALSQSTHLYGRRLVLEWADTQQTVDDLRKRTAHHFYQETTGPVKKRPKSTVAVEDLLAHASEEDE